MDKRFFQKVRIFVVFKGEEDLEWRGRFSPCVQNANGFRLRAQGWRENRGFPFKDVERGRRLFVLFYKGEFLGGTLLMAILAVYSNHGIILNLWGAQYRWQFTPYWDVIVVNLWGLHYRWPFRPYLFSIRIVLRNN